MKDWTEVPFILICVEPRMISSKIIIYNNNSNMGRSG